MSRVLINMPEKFNFSTELTVRVTDLNYGNHLGNDSVLSLAHESRIRFFNSLGYKDELSIDGLGIIIADAAVVYKSEAFLHDKLLIEISFNEFTKVGFDMVYRITNKSNSIVVAHVKTGILFYDYSQKKISRIPENFLQKVHSF